VSEILFSVSIVFTSLTSAAQIYVDYIKSADSILYIGIFKMLVCLIAQKLHRINENITCAWRCINDLNDAQIVYYSLCFAAAQKSIYHGTQYGSSAQNFM
jgi:hypothetical protein